MLMISGPLMVQEGLDTLRHLLQTVCQFKGLIVCMTHWCGQKNLRGDSGANGSLTYIINTVELTGF